MSQSHGKTKLAIAAVSEFSRAYPNSFYKVPLLLKHFEDEGEAEVEFVRTGPLKDHSSGQGIASFKIFSLLAFLLSNIRCFWRLSRLHANKLYVCYPGIILLLLMRLISRKHRPEIYLDAFISIYDTLVNDRKMLSKANPLAKLVFFIERSAFRLSKKVLTDTKSNSFYYADLYDLPQEKFVAVTLTGEEFQTSSTESIVGAVTCLFIGTFVPLQGVTVIAGAAQLLSHRDDIHFEIVGNGQDGESLSQLLALKPLENLHWESSWQNSESLQERLNNADICLGIFGNTDKADRVWPYKNHSAMSAGKALITGQSTQSGLLQQLSKDAFVTVDRDDPQALASAIEELADNPERRVALADKAQHFYQQHLSHEQALKELVSVLNS